MFELYFYLSIVYKSEFEVTFVILALRGVKKTFMTQPNTTGYNTKDEMTDPAEKLMLVSKVSKEKTKTSLWGCLRGFQSPKFVLFYTTC